MRPHLLRTAAEERQDRLLTRADRAADVADAAVQRVWRRLLGIIDVGGGYHQVRVAAAAALHSLTSVGDDLETDLIRLARDVAEWTRRDVANSLPAATARKLAAGRVVEAVPDDILELLLPAHPDDVLRSVVYAGGWRRRLGALTSLAPPDVVAALVAAGVQRGDHPYDIARDILPAVNNYKVSARRTARTAGMYVAHEAELRTHEQLGDLVKGYQIHATLDSVTRPEHRRRDGTIYYRNPAPGQLGFDKMPRPPAEVDGTLAFNCRCWLSPILDV